MNNPAMLLLAIVLLPLVGALFAGIFGSRFQQQPISSKRLIHSVVILLVALSSVLSFYTLYHVFNHGFSFNQTLYTWLEMQNLKLEIGFLVDKLTVVMMCVVTFVSLMVHVYTVAYMADDDGYARFFSYISLFTFAMLMLVMSNNLLQLFFGWEAVGVVSYLLIGFWFERQTAVYANLKAFLVNRVGDLGFAIGILLIGYHLGTLNYTEIFAKKDILINQVLAGTDWSLITVICVGLFIGAMGKSAQFPLHVWLPDSMEGPTPISALIHAATMVTAGIFMVSRLSPLFELSDAALSYILITGSVTALFMGFLGLVQTDIKRVVAYSTLSQLGYMTAALGASAYPMAIFHLFTHAFFKALLFLAAGSVIMGCHHNQDMRYMGNIKKYMPITHICTLLASLALIGTPFFSGFYSKDGILEAVKHANIFGAEFAYYALLTGVFVTAFYSFRMYFMVFHGKERYHQDPHADDHHGLTAGHYPHESNKWVSIPLLLLLVPSVIIGALTLPTFVGLGQTQGVAAAQLIAIDPKHPAMAHLVEEFQNWLHVAIHGFSTIPFYLAAAGVFFAWLFYVKQTHIPAIIAKRFAWIYKVLDNKYYLDAFNQKFFANGAMGLGKFLWRYIDQALIDQLLVNGVAKVTQVFARVGRSVQSGYLFHYILMMMFGMLFVILTVVIQL